MTLSDSAVRGNLPHMWLDACKPVFVQPPQGPQDQASPHPCGPPPCALLTLLAHESLCSQHLFSKDTSKPPAVEIKCMETCATQPVFLFWLNRSCSLAQRSDIATCNRACASDTSDTASVSHKSARRAPPYTVCMYVVRTDSPKVEHGFPQA